MAGNGKVTVVSLEKYKALEEVCLKMKAELEKLKEFNSQLVSIVESRPLRRELDWFANEMERVLSYNDATKGNTYRKMSIGHFADSILKNLVHLPPATNFVEKDSEQIRAARVLKVAVNMANYSMMIGTLAMIEAGKLNLE